MIFICEMRMLQPQILQHQKIVIAIEMIKNTSTVKLKKKKKLFGEGQYICGNHTLWKTCETVYFERISRWLASNKLIIMQKSAYTVD